MCHHLGIGVWNFVERNPSPQAQTVLLLLYANGPCSLCRQGCVSLLLDLDLLPDPLRAECRYDADFGIRSLVQISLEVPRENTALYPSS